MRTLKKWKQNKKWVGEYLLAGEEVDGAAETETENVPKRR